MSLARMRIYDLFTLDLVLIRSLFIFLLENINFPSCGYLLIRIDWDWKKDLRKDYEEENDTEIHIYLSPMSEFTLYCEHLVIISPKIAKVMIPLVGMDRKRNI